jgi:hypothetical protein
VGPYSHRKEREEILEKPLRSSRHSGSYWLPFTKALPHDSKAGAPAGQFVIMVASRLPLCRYYPDPDEPEPNRMDRINRMIISGKTDG